MIKGKTINVPKAELAESNQLNALKWVADNCFEQCSVYERRAIDKIVSEETEMRDLSILCGIPYNETPLYCSKKTRYMFIVDETATEYTVSCKVW